LENLSLDARNERAETQTDPLFAASHAKTVEFDYNFCSDEMERDHKAMREAAGRAKEHGLEMKRKLVARGAAFAAIVKADADTLQKLQASNSRTARAPKKKPKRGTQRAT